MSELITNLFAKIRSLDLNDDERKEVDKLEALANENERLETEFSSSFAQRTDSPQVSTRSISRTFYSISQTYDDSSSSHTVTVTTPPTPPPPEQ